MEIEKKQSYNISSSANSAVSAHDSNGYSAHGYGTSSSNTTGNVNTNSNVTIRDGAAAFEAQQIANRNIAEYNNQLEQKKQNRAKDYFADGIIKPFETRSGYINAEISNGEILNLEIIVDGIKYPFTFEIAKN